MRPLLLRPGASPACSSCATHRASCASASARLPALCCENGNGRRAPTGLQRGEQVRTGLLAAAAGFGAHATVSVRVGVLLAFIPAGRAGRAARFEQGANGRRVRLSLPRENRTRGCADVCAVGVPTDAPDQFGDHVLAEARVPAGGARLGTLTARLDTAHECVVRRAGSCFRVSGEHLMCNSHVSSSFPEAFPGAGDATSRERIFRRGCFAAAQVHRDLRKHGVV